MSYDVLLMGNGPVKGDHREWVDRSSFVVRFNLPRDNSATTGWRCDALCLSNHGDPARRIAKYRQAVGLKYLTEGTEIWFPRPRTRRAVTCLVSYPIRKARLEMDYSAQVLKRNGLMGHSQVYFSEVIWRRAYGLLSLDMRGPLFPSTGFLALVYLVKVLGARRGAG